MNRRVVAVSVLLALGPACAPSTPALRGFGPHATVTRVRSAHAPATAGSNSWVPLRIDLDAVPTESSVAVRVRVECVGRSGALVQRVLLHAGPTLATLSEELQLPRCPTGGLPQVEVRVAPPLTRCDPATRPAVAHDGGLAVAITLACDST